MIWHATAKGAGSSTVALSATFSGTAASAFKVFAGFASHAEAENVSGTVLRIAVHAE